MSLHGPRHHLWKGGRINQRGYIMIKAWNHPRANKNNYVWEHVLIAEKVLGRFLPAGAVVHHVNGIQSDNRNSNLLICENNAYHMFLHSRLRILDAGGDPDSHAICTHCHQLKVLDDFGPNKWRPTGKNHICRQCRRDTKKYETQRPNRRKEY